MNDEQKDNKQFTKKPHARGKGATRYLRKRSFSDSVYIKKQDDENIRSRRRSRSDSLFAALRFRHDAVIYASCVYCKILISVCISYLISELLVFQIDINYFEGFFTYLYVVSISFLLYIFFYLLDKTKQVSRLSRKLSKKVSINALDYSVNLDSSADDPKTSLNYRSHGSFILRAGVVVFGTGFVLFSLLDLAVSIKLWLAGSEQSSVAGTMNPILLVTLTLLQMWLICSNPRMNIHRFKTVGRFGMMHLVATNLCVWFNILMKESLHEIHIYDEMSIEDEKEAYADNHTMAHVVHTWHQHNKGDLDSESLLTGIVHSVTPYLLPLSIEYCLMCFSVTYLMWKNIGRVPECKKGVKGFSEKLKTDFVGSAKGLAAGVMIFLAFLACLIGFFLTSNKDKVADYEGHIFLIDGIQLVIIISNITVISYAFKQIQHLQPEPEPDDDLTHMLLTVSAFGWYIYCAFTGIAASLVLDEIPSASIVLIVNIITITEITIQLFLMNELAGKRIKPKHEETRPGRQIITYLFFSSLTLWLLYTFEVNKFSANAVQVEVFGPITWSVIMRLTLPMGIFFRFHSCVVYGEAWKNVYKVYKFEEPEVYLSYRRRVSAGVYDDDLPPHYVK